MREKFKLFLLGPDYMSRAGPVSRAGLSLPQQKSTSRLHDNRASPHRSSPANRGSPAHVVVVVVVAFI